MIVGEGFTDVYIQLAKLIRDKHEYVSSPRGMLINEALGVRFEITNARDRLLYIPARKMSLGYTIAEALWYFLGDNRTDWISYYSSFWGNISDDGETANSAYGARIFKPHDRVRLSGRPDDVGSTQWRTCIDELLRDSDSRRAYIHIKSPLDNDAKLDVPCTIGLQFFIRDKKLHLIVNMRSSDLILGITYDIPAFTFMQEAMLLELQSRGLDIELGRYIHVSNSLHVYERHFDMLNAIADTRVDVCVPMPAMCALGNWEDLNELQASFRSGEDIEYDLMSLGAYYADWVRILYIHTLRMRRLAAKRAGRRQAMLGLTKQLQVVRDSLQFTGYRFFKK